MRVFLWIIGCAWAIFLCPNLGFAQDEAFERELPKAVCDEKMISRAPTLSTTPETMIQNGTRSRDSSYFELSLDLTDRGLVELISNQNTADPASQQAVALDLCVALITPGELDALLKRMPGIFIPLKKTQSFLKIFLNLGASSIWKKSNAYIEDVESRFGILDRIWRAGGWVESNEVHFIKISSALLWRLRHPMTGIEKGIFVLDPINGRVLGSLNRLSSGSLERAPDGLEILHLKNIIEVVSLQALREHPNQSKQIRTIQEKLKSKISGFGSKADTVADPKKFNEVFKNLGIPNLEYLPLKHAGEFHKILEEFKRELKSVI